jgi:hypothetical protein
MPLECGECREKEKDSMRIKALCHHCGKPLCEKHCVKILDDAFANFVGLPDTVAIHCDSCRHKYHPRAAPIKPAIST